MSTQFDICKRAKLAILLGSRKSYRQIAKELGMSPSSIKREIERNRHATATKPYYATINDCAYARACHDHHLCGDLKCRRMCSACGSACAEGKCPKFKLAICHRRDKYPLVCNGCERIRSCRMTKITYDAKEADAMARHRLVTNRQGLNITTNELSLMSTIMLEGLRKGQSINHIIVSNRDDFPVCERTCYRYINKGAMPVKRHHLPNAVKLKPRDKPVEHKILRDCALGRTKEDFDLLMAANDGLPYVEMDTLLGPKGSRKALLTFQFPNESFMIARLLERKTAACVGSAIDDIYHALGDELFKLLFPVILTDNGTEFTNPVLIELAPNGEKRTRLFYARAYHATDKPHVERNHEHIRKVIPKGMNFDRATQADIDKIMSNINSYRRPVALSNRTPYDRFVFEYGKEAADRLGISKIEANDVTLLPAFFG